MTRNGVFLTVMPGLGPGIHVGPQVHAMALRTPTWIAGTGPAMTN